MPETSASMSSPSTERDQQRNRQPPLRRARAPALPTDPTKAGSEGIVTGTREGGGAPAPDGTGSETPTTLPLPRFAKRLPMRSDEDEPALGFTSSRNGYLGICSV